MGNLEANSRFKRLRLLGGALRGDRNKPGGKASGATDRSTNRSALPQGLIRFPGSRRRPAKWLCVKATQDASTAEDMLAHLASSWKVPSPSALLSVVGSMPPTCETGSYGEQQDRSLRRGLRHAAVKTNAWVVTSGTADGPGGWVGAALQKKSVPVIGCLPWSPTDDDSRLERTNASFVQRPPRAPTLARSPSDWHSFCVRPSGEGIFPDLGPSMASSQAPVGSTCSLRTSAGGGSQLMLDKNHTHFFLVDGEAEAEASCTRGRFEDLIRSRDLVGDGVATPMVG